MRLDAWPTILNTPTETLERAREVAKLLQQRSRPLIPLADHPLALLAARNGRQLGPSERLTMFANLVRSRNRLPTPPANFAHGFIARVPPCPRLTWPICLALVDSLLTPEPVGAAFATTPWGELSANLDGWIPFVRERCELRDKLAEIHKLNVQGTKVVACEAWSPGEAEDIFKQCQQMEFLTRQAIEAAHDLHTWIGFPRAAATRTDIGHLVALVDSLLAPAPVGEQFATTAWQEWVADLDQWTAWFANALICGHG